MTPQKDTKRNSKSDHADNLTPGRRVGARHWGSGGRIRGGGYPDNCLSSELSSFENKTPDIILAELREIGLRDDLLVVAENIGADKFVQIWQFLDNHYDERGDGRFRVSFPRFDKYMKYKRNEFIREKTSQGVSAPDIFKELKAQGYELSLRSVERLSKQFSNVSPD